MKGQKGVGHEYWGKRRLRCAHPGGGTKNKRVGIQSERAKLKQALLHEPREPEVHPNEDLSPDWWWFGELHEEERRQYEEWLQRDEELDYQEDLDEWFRAEEEEAFNAQLKEYEDEKW